MEALDPRAKLLYTFFDDMRWGELQVHGRDGELVITSFGLDVTDQVSSKFREWMQQEFESEIDATGVQLMSGPTRYWEVIVRGYNFTVEAPDLATARINAYEYMIKNHVPGIIKTIKPVEGK